MQDRAVPNFDEWVEYCFTQGEADFHAEPGSPDHDEVELRTDLFCAIDPRLLAEYVVKLFRNPTFLADRYTDEQIGDAVWFLFGCATEYFKDLRSASVPQDLQIECHASVSTLYTDLFDRVCGKRGEDPDTDYRDRLKVDRAVYMIWDMDCIEGAIMFPEDTPYLVEPGFEVLETVLERCRTSSCLVSALHGLGHIQVYHSQRVEQIIDRFLAARQMPRWVREYATQARTGCVQ